MKREDLLYRIENVDYLTIVKMSPEVVAKLTMEYDEFMVRKLLAKGVTWAQQRDLVKFIKKSYREWKLSTEMTWGVMPQLEVYPKYLEEFQLDIECGMMITDEEKKQNIIDEKMDDYMEKHTMTKEDIDKAISDAENKKITDEKSSEKTAVLEARIKELEEENKRLSKENEELKEIKMILDTPLDGIEADSKVGLTEILKLMENDGANFAKHNNKTIASKALKMMTGRSESACKQIFSSPLSTTYSGHKKKISELNGYLKALGMKTLLQDC